MDILDSPGYAPLINDMNMIEVAKEAAALALPNQEFYAYNSVTSGSTDMGDLSCVMPVVHPYVPGIAGTIHGADFSVADPKTACVGGAKFQLAMLFLLLTDDASRAKKIIQDTKPLFKSRKAYFDFLDSITNQGNRIEYLEDFAVKVNIQ